MKDINLENIKLAEGLFEEFPLSFYCPDCKERKLVFLKPSTTYKLKCDYCGSNIAEFKVPGGYVYITENEAFPGIVKIGETKNLTQRKRAANDAFTPTPWEYTSIYYTLDSKLSEAKIHKALENYKIPNKRELFQVSPGVAISIIEQIPMNDFHCLYREKDIQKAIEQDRSFTELEIQVEELLTAHKGKLALSHILRKLGAKGPTPEVLKAVVKESEIMDLVKGTYKGYFVELNRPRKA